MVMARASAWSFWQKMDFYNKPLPQNRRTQDRFLGMKQQI